MVCLIISFSAAFAPLPLCGQNRTTPTPSKHPRNALVPNRPLDPAGPAFPWACTDTPEMLGPLLFCAPKAQDSSAQGANPGFSRQTQIFHREPSMGVTRRWGRHNAPTSNPTPKRGVERRPFRALRLIHRSPLETQGWHPGLRRVTPLAFRPSTTVAPATVVLTPAQPFASQVAPLRLQRSFSRPRSPLHPPIRALIHELAAEGQRRKGRRVMNEYALACPTLPPPPLRPSAAKKPNHPNAPETPPSQTARWTLPALGPVPLTRCREGSARHGRTRPACCSDCCQGLPWKAALAGQSSPSHGRCQGPGSHDRRLSGPGWPRG